MAATRTVADAMITDIKTHGAGTTVRQLREFFRNEHVHAAVIVEGGTLLAVIDRADVPAGLDGCALAVDLDCAGPRGVEPDCDLAQARQLLIATGRRRLAVVGSGGELHGLLCLKRTRAGFCSAQDVRARSRRPA